MSTRKTDVTEMFQSMLQPLREAKQRKSGLSEKDLDMGFDRKEMVTPKAIFPKKGKPCTDSWLIEKHKE